MRVAFIADSHFCESKRFDECRRIHAWIAEDAKQRAVDLVVHCGDVFERQSSEVERLAAFDWFRDMADVAPVVVIRGNHDRLAELPALEKLDTRHTITVVEDAGVVEVETRAGVAQVACVAWPRKASILALSGVESHEAGEQLASELLRNLLRGLGQELRAAEGTPILAMHAMVRDSKTSTGQPLVGCDLEITLADLELVGAAGYFLGHVHLPQRWQIGGAPCLYVGSPRRSDFGELEDKGYTVATFQGGRCTHVEFVKTPCVPMVHLEGDYVVDDTLGSVIAVEGDPRGLVDGAEVRLRYRTSSEQREAARRAAEELRSILIADGAVFVQLEPVLEVEQRVQSAVIPEEAPLAEQVAAYWNAKGFDPADRREALTAKLTDLEGADHAA